MSNEELETAAEETAETPVEETETPINEDVPEEEKEEEIE